MEDIGNFKVENLIKGRMSEALIESLFHYLGFNVNTFSAKHSVPRLYSLLEGVRDDVAQNIKKMPDFVIQHPQSRKVYFVEVKFRANETLRFSELKDYPYENCLFVIVSKNSIRCISFEELKKEQKVSPESNYLLEDRTEFLTYLGAKVKISEYCDFAKKFFMNV